MMRTRPPYGTMLAFAVAIALMESTSPSNALSQVSAGSQLHWYRYALALKNGEVKVAGELPLGGAPEGQSFEVETDSLGRLVHVGNFRDGVKLSETTFHFANRDTLPDRWVKYIGGKESQTTRIQRNKSGDHLRDDRYTVAGVFTGYTQYTYGADSVEEAYFSSDSSFKSREVDYFSPRGVMIRAHSYAQDGYTEVILDEQTGLNTMRRRFIGDVLDSWSKYTYDQHSTIVREDVFGTNGRQFAALEYDHGFLMRKRYTYPGQTRVSEIIYDETKRPKGATWTVAGKLICTFTFERLADGTTTRTLAYGPDGTLLAEYPNRAVSEVSITGEAPDRKAAIIHKVGEWW